MKKAREAEKMRIELQNTRNLLNKNNKNVQNIEDNIEKSNNIDFQNDNNLPEETLNQCFDKIKRGIKPNIKLHNHLSILKLQNDFNDKIFNIIVNHCYFCKER